MKKDSYLSLVGEARRRKLEDGSFLRNLTAMEVLEAKREALSLSSEERELALCSNACLLARAWEKEGKPFFSSGEAVLAALSVSEIVRLTRLWSEFEREENPGFSEGEERIESLKKAWSTRRLSAFVGVCSARLGRSRARRG